MTTKVKLLTNLGTRDCIAFELDVSKCTIGATIDVKTEVAELLVQRGHAEVLSPDIQAVPKKPAIAKKKSVAGVVKEMKEATPEEFASDE